MFKRVFVEDWAQLVPFVSFFIFFTVYVFVTIRALRLGKAERARLASLPLEDNPDHSTPETP
jgi:cbb3-type cytochrome oxidase subunit 3